MSEEPDESLTKVTKEMEERVFKKGQIIEKHHDDDSSEDESRT